MTLINTFCELSTAYYIMFLLKYKPTQLRKDKEVIKLVRWTVCEQSVMLLSRVASSMPELFVRHVLNVEWPPAPPIPSVFTLSSS
jgi:hypothetical protein